MVTYVTHMYVVEVYLARADTHFHFMALKYCFGCLNLVLIPLAIIVLKPDIRDQTREMAEIKLIDPKGETKLLLQIEKDHLNFVRGKTNGCEQRSCRVIYHPGFRNAENGELGIDCLPLPPSLFDLRTMFYSGGIYKGM